MSRQFGYSENDERWMRMEEMESQDGEKEEGVIKRGGERCWKEKASICLER